jgi:peptidoglycan/LPS O-acetylase OafA/YrhL
MNELTKVNKLGYQPSLDGIRAIAVMLVMLLHAHFQFGSNGQIGVSLFFSMSGFLITTLLYEEFKQTGFISFSGFYIRRTMRLFPALYVLLIFCSIYNGFFIFDKEMQASTWKEIYASAFYLNNISWSWGWGIGSILLGHTWSLAVEEQFYLIWPLLLFVFMKWNRLNLLAMLLFLFIGVSWSMRLLGYAGPIYTSLVQESIFMGCLFALMRINQQIPSIPDWFLLVSTLLIVFVGIIPYESPINLFNPVGLLGGVLFVGLSQKPDGITSRILSIRPLVFIGKISYGMYLWHLPIFRWFANQDFLHGYQAFIGKFLTTFLLTYLSWVLIEKRSTKWGRRWSDKLKSKKKFE